MNSLNPFFPRHAFVFKGGGGGAPAMPAPPAPPATATSTEVVQAKIDAKRNAKSKTGIDSTILGSASGGGSGPMAPAAGANGGKSALLGGG
jgi:hypothetical protein